MLTENRRLWQQYQVAIDALSRRNRYFQHGPRVAGTTVSRLRLHLVQRIHHRHRSAGHEQLDVLLAVRVDALVDCRAIGQTQSEAVDLIAAPAILASEIRALDAARQRLRLEAAGFDAFPPLVGGEQAVPAFQAHVGPGAVEGKSLGLGHASGVLCQGFGEGVDGSHKGTSVPGSAHLMFAPNDKSIRGRFKTERRIVGHDIGSGKQYQGHFVADDGLGALDKRFADTHALVLLVYRQIREITAIRMVGQRAGKPHQLAIHPCRQYQARHSKHARDSREVAGGPLDAGLIEDANNVQRIKGKVMTIFDSGVFHWFTDVKRWRMGNLCHAPSITSDDRGMRTIRHR